MNCRDARLLLHAWLDDELDAADSLALTRHLADCADCTQRVRVHVQLRDALRKAELYRPASTKLRERIAAQLPRPAGLARAAVAARSPRSGWRFAVAALAALFVIAASFAGWQTLQLRRQDSNALIAAAVSDHVRSLLPGHLIDVRTSDQHTVKPWFDGRVDFSPQVKDLSAQGFELVGGRLDVLDGRQVAALVYRRHLHMINVFQWPGGAAIAGSAHTRDGYRVLQWNQDGLHFVAVSSVAEGDLQAFMRAFRGTPAPAGESTH
ncbi:MAG: anti-sigma factor [Xanthomonadaceae bacterium]|nr:anti-sigma factor [Xanthomonadaceae bacterium]MDE2053262.1 anti-sigma factor [Xanthomonadaceae bacterium]MDE2497991.1 anti-sigma factor [Xanthomonadaceae bacterium]